MTMSETCMGSVHGGKAEISSQAQAYIKQRYQDSPKNDRDRLMKCWGYIDCGDCHRSEGFCGWCAIVSLTVRPCPLSASTLHNLTYVRDSHQHVSHSPEIPFQGLSLCYLLSATRISALWALNALNCVLRGWDVRFLRSRFLRLSLRFLVRFLEYCCCGRFCSVLNGLDWA